MSETAAHDAAKHKLTTAMMLLEMCESPNDPELLEKTWAAHSYIQSAWFDVNGGGRRVAPSEKALALTSRIFADTVIDLVKYREQG